MIVLRGKGGRAGGGPEEWMLAVKFCWVLEEGRVGIVENSDCKK